MNGTQKVKLLSFGLIIVSAISIAMLTTMVPDQMGKLPLRLVRFVITCLFAFLLIRGTSWARWFVGVSSALGAVFSLIGLSAFGLLSIFGLWMIVMGLFYLVTAYYLLLDSDIGAHFG